MSEEFIDVHGARVHNLKNIDFRIPLHQLTVVSGVSGSGKSSLAFDTIYAEGQRRYVESLSAYARQFLERMEKPEVDSIEGIAPAIAIRQKNSTRNPRSTVATATEIYDYLRLLYARAGQTYCPDCDLPVLRDSVDTVAEAVLRQAQGRRSLVLFPAQTRPQPGTEEPAPAPKRGRGKAKKAAAPSPLVDQERLFDLRQKGFNRLYQDGKTVEFSTPESLLELDFSRPFHVIADRLVIGAESRSRIVDAVETAYREAGEVVFVFPAREGENEAAPLRFSERFECKRCGRTFEEPQPRLFSFNNPFGACPRCQGFGNTVDFDPNLVVPNPALTLSEGVIEPWTKPKFRSYQTELRRFARDRDIPLNVPWDELDQEDRDAILDGTEEFIGVRGFFEYLETKKYKLHVRVFLSRYRGYALCPVCRGARLRPEALWIRIGTPERQINIAQAVALTVGEAQGFFGSLQLSPEQAAVAELVLLEVQRRLEFLRKVGLDYLTLDRLASTLSGGEAQRIQLATCLGSHLVGALYVLDEPSIGLHTRDTRRLIGILEDLRDLGNTILVVEHDPDVIRAADHLLDMGPGAGEHGGRLVAAGSPQAITAASQSLTGKYLSGELHIPIPSVRRTPGRHRLHVEGATMHNLKRVDVELPLEMLVAITGVSGSGKSTLVHEVLHRNLKMELEHPGAAPTGCRALRGTEYVSDVVLVDQSPIGRTPRSNPVTYIKAFDAIRELFAQTPEAFKRGYSAGAFSFNIPGGRCETCQGDGVVTVDMQFLADVELVCEECGGTRFKSGVLDVRLREKNIHEVLQLTVREALHFFHGHPKVVRKLKILDDVGLGYLRLGQSATTLSGGEAQRIKLAAHLGQSHAGERMLFLFDEPTTGLHFEDIVKLLVAFRRLIEAGGTVVVIEHNLDVIKAVDWIIDLGPEGGEGGGRLVVAGSPEEVTRHPESYTGKYLGPVLAQHRALTQPRGKND